MFLSPSEFATILVLCLVAIAGMLAGMPVILVNDLRHANGGAGAVGVILGAGVVISFSQYAAYRFAKRIWRARADWTLLGHRRPLWQFFFIVAYGIGVACGLLIAYDI